MLLLMIEILKISIRLIIWECKSKITSGRQVRQYLIMSIFYIFVVVFGI